MTEGIRVDADGFHKFLLGPFYLYDDLTSAAIPGIVFFLLLLTKKVEAVHSMLAAPYLGYKTKIVVGFLMSYVTGKVFQLPSAIALNILGNFDSGSLMLDKPDEKGSLSDMFVGRGRNIVTGVILGVLLAPINAFDLWIIARAHAGFYLNTG